VIIYCVIINIYAIRNAAEFFNSSCTSSDQENDRGTYGILLKEVITLYVICGKQKVYSGPSIIQTHWA